MSDVLIGDFDEALAKDLYILMVLSLSVFLFQSYGI